MHLGSNQRKKCFIRIKGLFCGQKGYSEDGRNVPIACPQKNRSHLYDCGFLKSRGSRNRTHIDGFGDHCSTFELCPYILLRYVGDVLKTCLHHCLDHCFFQYVASTKIIIAKIRNQCKCFLSYREKSVDKTVETKFTVYGDKSTRMQ